MSVRRFGRSFSLVVSLLVTAGCSSGSGGNSNSTPVISSFTADPAAISPGQSATLRWSVTNASALSIDHSVGSVSGTSVVVSPTDTTTYTLTATSAGGTASASTTVTVRAPPVISSFTAAPLSITSGSSTTLSWSVSNATSLIIDQGVGDVSGLTTKTVSPRVDTTYTLTATGPGGTVTRSTSVSVTPLLHVQYDDPPAGVGKLRLVRNPASTATHLILDLQVGGTQMSGFGVALTLPMDPSKVTFTPASGLILNPSVLDAGTSPSSAAAILPTNGPLQNMLVVGVARKKHSVGDGDVILAAGETVFSVVLDMNGQPATGTIFTGTNLGAKSRAALLNKTGTVVVSQSEFAIGDLSISF